MFRISVVFCRILSKTYWICSAFSFKNCDFTTSVGKSFCAMRIVFRLAQTVSSIRCTSSSNRALSVGLRAASSAYSMLSRIRSRYCVRIRSDSYLLFSLFVSLVFNCVGFSCAGFSCAGFACTGFSRSGLACTGFSGSGFCGCSNTVYSILRTCPLWSRTRRRMMYPAFSSSRTVARIPSTPSLQMDASPRVV